MSIKTQQSMSGFVVTDPALSFTEQGVARLYLRVGQHHYNRNEDGSFTETEPTFHDLVMYRKSAERAAAIFTKGDRFVAEGYTHTFTVTDADGVMSEREEFVARRLGHDCAVTDYAVDRSHREARSQAVESPTQQQTQQTVSPGISSQAGLATFRPSVSVIAAGL